MQWNNGTYAGFTQAEPWLAVSAAFREEITVEVQQQEDDSILAFYKQLIKIRKRYPAIAKGDISFLETGADMVIAYQRTLGEQHMVLGNKPKICPILP